MKAVVTLNGIPNTTVGVQVYHERADIDATVTVVHIGIIMKFQVPATGFPEGGGYLFTADDLIKFLEQPLRTIKGN